MRQHSSALVAALVMALTVVSSLGAQATGTGADTIPPDPAAAPAADSVRAAAGVPLADTAPGPDRAPTPGTDTLAPAPRDTAAPPSRPAPPPPPLDSALAAACEGIRGTPPDLLLVSFRSTASHEERAAVAAEVGGRLIGPAQIGPPDSYYIGVPGGASDREVADRLIRLEPVVQVGTTRCPS